LMEENARSSVLFLDACRDNPLHRAFVKQPGTRSIRMPGGLATAEAGAGTLISYATQPGNIALDGAGRNSPYAGALVRHITHPDLDLSGILIAVRNDVMTATAGKQVPWEHSALTGRIFFRDAAAATGQTRKPQTRGAPAAVVDDAPRCSVSAIADDGWTNRGTGGSASEAIGNAMTMCAKIGGRNCRIGENTCG
jgi:uncharacterized caspase-like protein